MLSEDTIYCVIVVSSKYEGILSWFQVKKNTHQEKALLYYEK